MKIKIAAQALRVYGSAQRTRPAGGERRMRMAQPRSTSTHSNRELMDLLAEIAQVASPGDSHACTQRAFDEARARAGHANCPTAQQVCVRLNAGREERRTWGEWLEIVLTKSAAFLDRSAAKVGTVKQSSAQHREAAQRALRVARNEGEHHRAKTAYDAWRAERVANLEEQYRHVWPTSSQITTAYGNWTTAVTAINHGEEHGGTTDDGYGAAIDRPVSRLSDRALIDALERGVRAANPDNPARCTQRAFDAVRDQLEGFDGHIPSAQRICARLNLGRVQRRSWSEWVELALDKHASIDQILGRGRTDARAGGPNEEEITFAIKWVASQTGEITSAVGYDKAREEKRHELPRQVRHVLPTAAQITHVTDTWEAALAIAGLGPREVERANGGVSGADMIRAFVHANAAWPTKRALEQFGKDADVRWRRPHQDGVALRDALADLHREMEARGENPPALTERWSAQRGRPTVDLGVPEFAAAPTATEAWTPEAAIDAVAGWLRERNGREATWRAYIADAAGNPLLPQGSTITRFGGWAEVRKQAGKVR